MELQRTEEMPSRWRRECEHGGIFGATGTGKTTLVVNEIEKVHNENPNDLIYVIDPIGEYKGLLERKNIPFVNLKIGVDTFINPCFMPLTDDDMVAENNGSVTIAEKSDFLASFAESIMFRCLNKKEFHSICEASERMYESIVKQYKKEQSGLSERISPTFVDFYEGLLESDDKDVLALAMAIEPLAVGRYSQAISYRTKEVKDGKEPAYLDCPFNDENTVYIFDLSAVPYSQKSITMLCCFEYLCQHAKAIRYREKKCSWLYLEEFHEYLMNTRVASYLEQKFKYSRKFGIKMMITCLDIGYLIGMYKDSEKTYTYDDIEWYGRGIFNSLGTLYYFKHYGIGMDILTESLAYRSGNDKDKDELKQTVTELRTGECICTYKGIERSIYSFIQHKEA